MNNMKVSMKIKAIASILFLMSSPVVGIHQARKISGYYRAMITKLAAELTASRSHKKTKKIWADPRSRVQMRIENKYYVRQKSWKSQFSALWVLLGEQISLLEYLERIRRDANVLPSDMDECLDVNSPLNNILEREIDKMSLISKEVLEQRDKERVDRYRADVALHYRGPLLVDGVEFPKIAGKHIALRSLNNERDISEQEARSYHQQSIYWTYFLYPFGGLSPLGCLVAKRTAYHYELLASIERQEFIKNMYPDPKNVLGLTV